jgi:hypothetical protein
MVANEQITLLLLNPLPYGMHIGRLKRICGLCIGIWTVVVLGGRRFLRLRSVTWMNPLSEVVWPYGHRVVIQACRIVALVLAREHCPCFGLVGAHANLGMDVHRSFNIQATLQCGWLWWASWLAKLVRSGLRVMEWKPISETLGRSFGRQKSSFV